MSRQAELLRKAADALDDGQIPLMNPFLADNDVTFDECMDMAGLMAEGTRLIAWAMENPKAAAAVVQGAGLGLSHHAFMVAMEKLNRR
jgi:hypothetical protein